MLAASGCGRGPDTSRPSPPTRPDWAGSPSAAGCAELPEDAGGPEPERGHLLAHSVALGDIGSVEPAARSLVEKLPWEQEASGKPVSFLLLLRVAGEEAQPAHFPPLLHHIADPHF